MQTSTKILIGAALIVLPIVAISAMSGGNKKIPSASTQPTVVAAKQAPVTGKRLNRADTNADGAITKDEYFAYARIKAEKRFAEYDLNKDGVITKQEMDSVNARKKQSIEASRKARAVTRKPEARPAAKPATPKAQ